MVELIIKVEKWFIERGLDNADPTKQMLKLFEEVSEVARGMARSDLEATKDGIGDVLVVLIGLSLQLGVSLEDCLEFAYEEIKDRKGKVINGVYVKDGDIHHGPFIDLVTKKSKWRCNVNCYVLSGGDIAKIRQGQIIKVKGLATDHYLLDKIVIAEIFGAEVFIPLQQLEAHFSLINKQASLNLELEESEVTQ